MASQSEGAARGFTRCRGICPLTRGSQSGGARSQGAPNAHYGAPNAHYGAPNAHYGAPNARAAAAARDNALATAAARNEHRCRCRRRRGSLGEWRGIGRGSLGEWPTGATDACADASTSAGGHGRRGRCGEGIDVVQAHVADAADALASSAADAAHVTLRLQSHVRRHRRTGSAAAPPDGGAQPAAAARGGDVAACQSGLRGGTPTYAPAARHPPTGLPAGGGSHARGAHSGCDRRTAPAHGACGHADSTVRL